MEAKLLYSLSAGTKFHIENFPEYIFSYGGRIDGVYGRCNYIKVPEDEAMPEIPWTFLAAWTPCMIIE